MREDAKAAVKGDGFDLLLVCAFAFAATAGEAVAEFKPQDFTGLLTLWGGGGGTHRSCA